MIYSNRFCLLLLIGAALFVLCGCAGQDGFEVEESEETVTITTENYQLQVEKGGFRYRFEGPEGDVIAPAHPESGLQMGPSSGSLAAVTSATLEERTDSEVVFAVETEGGITAQVQVRPEPHAARFDVQPEEEGSYAITGRTGGLSPSYGLADHGTFQRGGGEMPRESPDVTGFTHDHMHAGNDDFRSVRMVSNFVVFPKHGFAAINIDPWFKIVRVTEKELVQGSRSTGHLNGLYYFIGDMKQVYREFLDTRNSTGYRVRKPKYEFFGVGWEAFGALGADTDQETVSQNVDRYLDLGFPLEWMVVGSGFWPKDNSSLEGTTSFGMWDDDLYPTPERFIRRFRDQGLKFIIGLRTFFTVDGPYTEEGLENGYFISKESGQPYIWEEPGWPKQRSYMLDGSNPEAVEWYNALSQKWEQYGVDGFKEDVLSGVNREHVRDDNVNFVNRALMDRGVYVMGRNNYLGSPVDIHRYNDFNYNQPQDRGPINGLAFAYSGFPNVYPDIVGGTGLATDRFGEAPESKLRTYLMRYAQYAALNPSMSFGYGPWNYGEEVVEVTREAARLHDRLQPYIYSNAMKAAETGFPHPMTPLPLAYPNDPQVYGLADTTRRSYQWLIGESLLATPLYGDDYARAESRDVYLPEGTWMEYDSGEVHEGPTTLEDYPLPVGKTPLFVGGSGIVVEEVEGELKGRLYPIADQAETLFYDRDGETQSTITVAGPDWEDPTVIDQSTGEEVPGTWRRHAYEFTLTPGHDYRVE